MAGGQWSMVVVLMVIMVASFQLQSTMAQTRHVVGDKLGWTIPPGGAATYTTWAARRTFIVGDILFFNFTTGLHNVAEVSQAAFGPCATTNTLSLNPTGPTTVTLTRPGAHYYMCTVVSHCQIGQKLSINVSPATTTAIAPQSTPRSPLSTVAIAPSTVEVSPTGSPISPLVSGSPVLAAIVPVTFLAAALAFYY